MAESILVVGGTGLVGNALVRAWEARGVQVAAATYHCHPSPLFRQLDMQDKEAVRRAIGEFKPTVVAIPAANPHVDYCETHPEETRSVNVLGTGNVLAACREAGARAVFFSSDYVFDGAKAVYTEEDAVCPINEYGRQKAETERLTLGTDPRNLVVRTSGAYGWQWEPKNFVLQVRARLSAGERVKVARDLRYNPTYVENLAEIVAALVEKGARGIYHAVGADRVVRFDFAAQIARTFGLDAGLLEPVEGSLFPSAAPRPKDSSLSPEKLRAFLPSLPPLGTGEGLKRMAAGEAAWRLYSAKLPKTVPDLLK